MIEEFRDGRLRVLTKCSGCSTDLWRRKSHLHERSFCSYSCRSAYMTTSVKVECANCRNSLRKTRSAIRRSKSGNYFCNRSCATSFNNKFKVGENHGNWNGGFSNYRSKALKHYGSFCSNPQCPLVFFGVEIPEKMLDVHHIDSDRSNNEIENLQVLCVWCHAKKTRATWP